MEQNIQYNSEKELNLLIDELISDIIKNGETEHTINKSILILDTFIRINALNTISGTQITSLVFLLEKYVYSTNIKLNILLDKIKIDAIFNNMNEDLDISISNNKTSLTEKEMKFFYISDGDMYVKEDFDIDGKSIIKFGDLDNNQNNIESTYEIDIETRKVLSVQKQIYSPNSSSGVDWAYSNDIDANFSYEDFKSMMNEKEIAKKEDL